MLNRVFNGNKKDPSCRRNGDSFRGRIVDGKKMKEKYGLNIERGGVGQLHPFS